QAVGLEGKKRTEGVYRSQRDDFFHRLSGPWRAIRIRRQRRDRQNLERRRNRSEDDAGRPQRRRRDGGRFAGRSRNRHRELGRDRQDLGRRNGGDAHRARRQQRLGGRHSVFTRRKTVGRR